MAKDVIVGNEPFKLSQSGDAKGWGSDQEDLIQALIDQVNSFFGPGDILPTTALIQNNAGTYGGIDTDTPTPGTYELITSFQFDSNVVRFFEVEYTVIRVSSTEPTVYEVGKIFGLNDPTVTSGNAWTINVQKMSDAEAGIDFDINSSGQMVYATTDIANYNPADSFINFKAKAIVKTIT